MNRRPVLGPRLHPGGGSRNSTACFRGPRLHGTLVRLLRRQREVEARPGEVRVRFPSYRGRRRLPAGRRCAHRTLHVSESGEMESPIGSQRSSGASGCSGHGGGSITVMSRRRVCAMSVASSSSVISGFAFIMPTMPNRRSPKVSGTSSISMVR